MKILISLPIALAFSITVLFANGLCAASSLYKTDDNIIVNGNFNLDKDRNGVPDSWIRHVQMPGAKAEVMLENNGRGNCVRIRFFKPEFMLQARVYQKIKVIPGKVYELKFRYKSAQKSNLKADVLMTGTGPIYRSIQQVPVKNWTTKREIFLVPSWMKGPAAIYVQNRSTVPIRYDDISFRATDIPPKKVKEYQAQIIVQPVSSDDQLIMPGTGKKEVEFVTRIHASSKMLKSLYPVARLLINDKIIPCKVKDGRITLPIKSIPDGTSRLSVLLFERKENVLVASSNLKIEKIPPAMMKGNLDLKQAAVYRGKNGKPFFPIGMYGLNVKASDREMIELKENGFNTIHCYSFEGKWRKDSARKLKNFLVKAQKNGLKVATGLPREWVERNGKNKYLTNYLNMFKQFPAVEFYYSDEMYSMRNTPVKLIKLAYSTIKKLDPRRKWIIYEVPEKKLAPYMDGIMIGAENSNTAKLIRLRIGDNKPVFSVFGQQDYKAGKSPSLKEIRYKVFMPVILGSRGLFYWWYPTLLWHNQEKDILRKRLYASVRVLAQIAPAMVSGEKSPAFVKQIKTSGSVRYCYGSLKGTTYIIAGVEKAGKQGIIEFPVPAGYNIESILDPKQKFTKKRSCRLSLEPGETVLIKVSKN